MKLREIFETWARRVGDKFHDQQWLLSKWDCQEGILWPEDKFRAMVDGILEDFDISPGNTVADLGCGGGWILQKLARRPQQVIGVDFSRTMLENAGRLNPEQTFVCADIARLPFKKEVFDRVLCYFVFINFVDDDLIVQSLNDIVRLLKPGGRALIGQLPDGEESEVYDREKKRYIQYCREEFSLSDDLRKVCRVPLRLFNRRHLEEILRTLDVSYHFRDSFNPFYRAGEPERISWRFDLLLDRK